MSLEFSVVRVTICLSSVLVGRGRSVVGVFDVDVGKGFRARVDEVVDVRGVRVEREEVRAEDGGRGVLRVVVLSRFEAVGRESVISLAFFDTGGYKRWRHTAF